MLVSRNLIEQYVNLKKYSDAEIAEKLTFAGIEVEQVIRLASASNLVIGEVVQSTKIADTANLSSCVVRINSEGATLPIVCGAPNVRAGQKVIVAKVGAKLPLLTIKETVIKGHTSKGMICSLNELGVPEHMLSAESKAGIEVLASDAPVGESNVLDYMGLADTLFDIKPLPNRSDVYALYNLARELGALFEEEVNIPAYDITNDFKTLLTLKLETPLTRQFALTEVQGVKVTDSPAWLQTVLLKHGMRPVNNIVDIGNYVMLLTGRPLHMYDVDKLKSTDFVVTANFTQDFVALDEVTYTADIGDQSIVAGGELACLGGVLGAKSTGVTNTSKNIALEVATFDHAAIRRTMSRAGITSEASLRFARGVDESATLLAMNLALHLIKEANKTAKISNTINKVQSTLAKREVIYNKDRINALLGTDFSDALIQATLKRVGITVGKDKVVTVPSYRLDIFTNACLAEEVIRLLGFSHVSTKLPALTASVGHLTSAQTKRNNVRSYLRNSGLYETLTYTLVSEEEAVLLQTLHTNTPLSLQYPMTPVHTCLRTHILPSLLSTARYNVARQNSDFALFELSEITAENYHGEHLALVLVGGKKMQDELSKVAYDFYDVKGYVESILALLNIKENRYRFVANENYTHLHPYQSADLYIGNAKVGVVGALHPTLSKAYDFISTPYVVELDFSALTNVKTSEAKMETISRFPSVSRDLALVVDASVTSESVITGLKRAGGKLVTSIKLFDVFTSALLGENKKSLALSVTLSAADRTLREEEIIEVMDKLINVATTKLGATLRG